MNNEFPNLTISIDLPKHFLYVMNKINRDKKPIGYIHLYKTITHPDVVLLKNELLNLHIYVKGYNQSDFAYYDEYYDLYIKVCHIFNLSYYANINHMKIIGI